MHVLDIGFRRILRFNYILPLNRRHPWLVFSKAASTPQVNCCDIGLLGVRVNFYFGVIIRQFSPEVVQSGSNCFSLISMPVQFYNI